MWLAELFSEDHAALSEDMIDWVHAILIFADTDEDKIFDELHALELLEDELLFSGVQLLVFQRHSSLQF